MWFKGKVVKPRPTMPWLDMVGLLDEEGDRWLFQVAIFPRVVLCRVVTGDFPRVVWESRGKPEAFYHDSRETRISIAMGILQRLANRKVAGKRVMSCDDNDALTEFPGIMELLGSPNDADGNPRTQSSITLVFQDGVFKAGLNEKDLKATCWVSSLRLDALLAVLEAKLQSEDAEWRSWPGEQGKRQGGKQR